MSTSVLKGIHNGSDQRYNLFQVEEVFEQDPALAAQIREQARSVACLINKSCLNGPTDDGGYQIAKATRTKKTPKIPTLSAKIKEKYGAPLSKKQSFRKEISIGSGTAFLIGKRIALTAGHCVCSKKTGLLDKPKIQAMLLVFDFHMSTENETQTQFGKSDVYRIANVTAYHYTEATDKIHDDWAVLCLDREVEGRKPLDITICDSIPLNERVYMLGHPSGLPLKLAKNGEIEESDNDKAFFQASLDAFEGNSGSPVFIQKMGLVAGILFRGTEDYTVVRNSDGDQEVKTSYASKEELEAKGWEKCQKITFLVFLRSILSSIDIPPPLGGMGIFNQNLQAGLSLEAICTCNQVSAIVISRGFGLFNLSEECATAICSSCNTNIHPDNVNTVILSSCQYHIDGLNLQNQKIYDGPFKLLRDANRVMRFDVQNWYYLEFKVKQL